jgi:hypothetical protein
MQDNGAMAQKSTPAISRVLPDGTLIELVHDMVAGTTAFALISSNGEPLVADCFVLSDDEVLIPYAAGNNLLASGCVVLPSTFSAMGSKADLLTDLKAFIHRYVAVSPIFEEIAAHYILLSWIYDAFNEVPYLRLAGDYGSGKTRGLLVLGSLAYKGFFASGASTVSPIFHILHEFGGTLVLDEADLRFSDATADLTKILNNGTMKGLPVLRTMTNRHRELNPQAFRVFGPKIVGMRERFQDEALESRFLTEIMTPSAMRSDIPLHLPDTMKVEAGELRNRLLAWRFAHRHQVRIDPDRAIAGLSPRGNQMALPILSLVDDPDLRDAIGRRLATAEARAVATRAARPDIAMARVLDQLFREGPYVPVARACDAFNQETSASLPVKSVGHIIRRDLGLATTKTRGVYVVPASERAKVTELMERYAPQESQAAERWDLAREARENHRCNNHPCTARRRAPDAHLGDDRERDPMRSK